MELKVCPKCKEKYKGYPAISRVDNKTEICPTCGSAEAIILSMSLGKKKVVLGIDYITEEEKEIVNEFKRHKLIQEQIKIEEHSERIKKGLSARNNKVAEK